MGRSQSRSVLFLSADLVGSTHHKSESDWQVSFLNFYLAFPQHVGSARKELGAQNLVFDLWKAIGDEIVYMVTVCSEREVAQAILVWLHAMSTCESEILMDKGLSLKGSSFVATLPGPDSEVAIRRSPDPAGSVASVISQNDAALRGKRSYTQFQYDYMGPSIDIGFRLAALATNRHFTLSVEVARALSFDMHLLDATPTGETPVEGLVFFGSHSLKGVWKGREYPVFAIDRARSNALNVALASMNGKPPSAKQILEVCRACAQDENWLTRLYLPNSQDEAVRSIPADAMADARANETVSTGFETVEADDGGGEALGMDVPTS